MAAPYQAAPEEANVKPSHMNLPPEDFVRIPYEEIEALVDAVGRAAGLPADKAALLAELLVGNDLKGTWSHGSRQIAAYARQMRDGELNPDPQVRVVQESAQTVLVDGDGGLGYFPAYEGTLLAIQKAEATGMAALVTRNHGHFGAAGIYARLTLGHGLLTFVTSGHQLDLRPGRPLTDAAGGSPMAWTAPAAQEDSLVLDFGTMHDFYDQDPYRDDLIRMVPGVALRHIGMGEVCQAWGGLLAGLTVSPQASQRQYPGANQGSFLFCLRISLFLPEQQFEQQMDAYARAVHALEPLPPFSESYLPGAVEAARERDYRANGVPMTAEHRRVLAEVADEFSVPVPW